MQSKGVPAAGPDRAGRRRGRDAFRVSDGGFGMQPQGDLITVASYPDAIKAHLARGRLEAEGIPAVVADEHYVSANWMMSNALGGVKVQVSERMVERAVQVLRELDAGEFALAEESREESHCPRCGSSAIETNTGSWRIALLGLHLFQIPLPFTRLSHRCRHCGHTWS
jgi:hypothetical protein